MYPQLPVCHSVEYSKPAVMRCPPAADVGQAGGMLWAAPCATFWEELQYNCPTERYMRQWDMSELAVLLSFRDPNSWLQVGGMQMPGNAHAVCKDACGAEAVAGRHEYTDAV